MTARRGLVSEQAVLGITIAALGCAPPQPGFTLDDEGESGDDSIGDGDADAEVESDEGSNDIPFELESAFLNATGQFVALRFSEPVAPVDGIDPGDFRISVAMPVYLCNYYDCKLQTTYWDPNFYADHYIGLDPYSTARFEADMITAGNMPTDIFLRFGLPLDPVLCEWFSPYGDLDFLFVHHSPGGIPVRSADGEELAPIGPEWVEIAPEYVWADYGDFPHLNPKIPIPCSL